MVARIYNNLNTVLEQCVHSITYTVLEQCSKYFRTVNGAAPWDETTEIMQIAIQYGDQIRL